MWPPDLNGSERKDYVDAINSATTITKVEVDLLNLDHEHLYSLDDMFDDGQVNFNRGTDVDRSLQAGFIDPSAELLELDLRHLIQVKHHLWVPALNKWAVTPMMTGRVMVTSTDGEITTVELHGKESFALDEGEPRRTWKAGRRVVGVIREMFEDIGETKFRISPGIKAELKDEMVSGGPDSKKAPMRVARRLGESHGLQVFYDELGFLVVRRRPKTPVISWNENDNGLLSPVSFTRDLREVRNTVKGSGKKTLRATAEAEKHHIFSAHSLIRGGVPGERVAYLDDDSIGRKSKLQEAVDDMLDRLMTTTTDASYVCLPAYHVGPFDRVRAEKRNGKFGEFFPTEATIPLGDGNMTVGSQERRRKNTSGGIRL